MFTCTAGTHKKATASAVKSIEISSADNPMIELGWSHLSLIVTFPIYVSLSASIAIKLHQYAFHLFLFHADADSTGQVSTCSA